MLGTILRKEREGKQLTLKDVERAISIRTKYLEAIESERYGELPGEVYVKGFIRNYAKFLGLDADTIMRVYNEDKLSLTQAMVLPPDLDDPEAELAESSSAHVVTADDVAKAKAAAAAAATEAAGEGDSGNLFSSGDDFKRRTESHTKQYVMLALGLLVAAVVGCVFYFFGDPNSSVAKPEPTQAEETAAASEPAPAVSGVEVVAVFNDRCWTYVVIDGKPAFEATTNPGERHAWTGRQRVDLTMGNAGAATVTYNGRSLGALGKVGEVIEKQFIVGQALPVDASKKGPAASAPAPASTTAAAPATPATPAATPSEATNAKP